MDEVISIILIIAILTGICLMIGYIGLRGTYVCESNPDRVISFGPIHLCSYDCKETNWKWKLNKSKHAIIISNATNKNSVICDFYQEKNYNVIYIDNVKYVRKTLNYYTCITKKVEVKLVYKDYTRTYKIKMGQTSEWIPPIYDSDFVGWFKTNYEDEKQKVTTGTRFWENTEIYAMYK